MRIYIVMFWLVRKGCIHLYLLALANTLFWKYCYFFDGECSGRRVGYSAAYIRLSIDHDASRPFETHPSQRPYIDRQRYMPIYKMPVLFVDDVDHRVSATYGNV